MVLAAVLMTGMTLALAWYHIILATLFASICILLMLVILLQRGRGVGLAGAFGGAGGVSALGAKTGDILTWVTMVLAAVFVLLAIGLNYVFVQATPRPVGGELEPAGGAPVTPPPAGGAPAAPWADGEFGAAATPDGGLPFDVAERLLLGDAADGPRGI